MSAAVAFRVEKVAPEFFVPVLVFGNGGELRGNPCVCAAQARSTATRHGTRTLDDLGLFERLRGELVRCDEEPCGVSPSSWVWQGHAHTHR